MADPLRMQPLKNRQVAIDDHGKRLLLDYADVEAQHAGDSWFGVCAGFRAMQAASRAFSDRGGWDRNNLYIVSGHPGNGVRDAIDSVTHCVRLGRYRLLDSISDKPGCCSRDMRFVWWLCNGKVTIRVRMNDDFIPREFYEVLDRLSGNNERDGDRIRFAELKRSLAETLWNQTLDAAFVVEQIGGVLSPGELPDA